MSKEKEQHEVVNSDGAGIDAAEIERSIPSLAAEINRAFPGLKCLRCGNEKFFLSRNTVMGQVTPNDDGSGRIAGGHLATFSLVCQQCGMVEQHSENILLNANKPI